MYCYRLMLAYVECFCIQLARSVRNFFCSRAFTRGGGDLPYITDGDVSRNLEKQPLKVTILGVAPANFIP